MKKHVYADLSAFIRTACTHASHLGREVPLLPFYVKEHAENFMMHLMVENADEWWEHIQSLGLAEKYSLSMAKPPTLQPWGLRVLYLTDPTGVLWHIADRRTSSDP